ncbi:MAG: PD-(D/E)XK nuclease family protein [Acidobacteriaceae bacterium]
MSPLNIAATRKKMRTEQELLLELQRNIDGAAIVASTVRAARALRQQYNRQQQAAGNHGWRTPQILAWEPWLKTLWDAAILCGAESRILLNDAQEAELWLQVLDQDEAGAQTMSIAGLARQAQQTWRAMQLYRIELRHVRNDGSIDAQAFSRWATELEKICRRSSVVPFSQVEPALASTIQTGNLPLPKAMFLVGFDRTTPSQELLIEALRVQGCQVEMVEIGPPPTEIPSGPAIVYARTPEEEIAGAAQWIRATLLENPGQRIGVVLPALGEIRDRMDAAFRRVLAPSSMDVQVSDPRLPYEFSLGTPMHRMQAIRTALTLLAWLDTPLPPEEISWLLVHGGFGSRSSDARAMLDKKFRDRDFQLGGSISFASFREWLANSGGGEDGLPLRRTLERFAVAAKRQDMGKKRSFADWRECVEELLAAADWTLLTATDSAEYQLRRRWNALLNELSSLSAVTGTVPFSAALDRLKALAANLLFTLETRNAPVQILGVSEAAGLTFDRIWWMNAQASSWPPRGHAQPFLPWGVQRAANMPYADPAADAAFAHRVTKRVLASAQTVIVSFALQESDPTTASAHVPSPEIALSAAVRSVLPGAPLVAVEDFIADRIHPQTKSGADRDSSALEKVEEEPTVPFRGSQVRGGVNFLKQQAACPFRAFAELRLAAEPPAEPESGLPAKAQGTILHEVLQNFWNEMQSQKKLLESTEEQCRQMLHGHVRNALRRFFAHAEEPWQRALLEIEADRIESRLLAWLEVEKRRSDFTVLKTEDALEQVHLGGVNLRCRIDRIDQVEQGLVLMDYKAKMVDGKACDGERPDEPQLPAYAVLRQNSSTDEKPLAGVAFAGLHPRNVGFTVVGSLAEIFPVAPGATNNPRGSLSPEALQQQQEEWRTTLTRLAEDFHAGVAVVDPKRRNETCRYCAQGLLCRIREAEDFVEEENPDDVVAANSSQSFDA